MQFLWFLLSPLSELTVRMYSIIITGLNGCSLTSTQQLFDHRFAVNLQNLWSAHFKSSVISFTLTHCTCITSTFRVLLTLSHVKRLCCRLKVWMTKLKEGHLTCLFWLKMSLKTQDQNTYPLVKLFRPKAIEMKKTADGHVVALDISITSKLDTPMAKDWGQTHMQTPYSQVHAVLEIKKRFAFTKSQTRISGLSQLFLIVQRQTTHDLNVTFASQGFFAWGKPL